MANLTEERRAKMAKARLEWKEAGGQRTGQVYESHTIRSPGGDLVVLGYNRAKAIKYFCSECLGYEGSPRADCTSPLCPLWPFKPATVQRYAKDRSGLSIAVAEQGNLGHRTDMVQTCQQVAG